MDNHFPHVTEDKQKYALTKLNIIFMVSKLQIPFNKRKSSNSHKSEKRRINPWLLEEVS